VFNCEVWYSDNGVAESLSRVGYTSLGWVHNKPMLPGVTTLLKLLDPEDASVMIFLNVDTFAVSGTSSLHPQPVGHVCDLRE
jgi:hypothetical protein